MLTAASIGCALAESLTVLLCVRFVQGIGASVCLLLATTIAVDCFRGPKLASVLGVLGAAWGTAPILAPALGGLLVQIASWRLVLMMLAALTAAIAVVVANWLPETLNETHRVSVSPRRVARVLTEAVQHRVFLGFVAMFGLIGAAQMVFGVVGPFLYEVKLGFSPAAYGLIALVVGAVNLAGELACGGLAHRTGTRPLAVRAWSVFLVGGIVLVASAEVFGVNAWAITVGAALALAGIGVLDPLSKGLAMGTSPEASG